MNQTIILNALNKKNLKKGINQLLVDCTHVGMSKAEKHAHLKRYLHERIYQYKNFNINGAKKEIRTVERQSDINNVLALYKTAYIDLMIKLAMDKNKFSAQERLIKNKINAIDKELNVNVTHNEFIDRYQVRDEQIVLSQFIQDADYQIEKNKLRLQNPTKTWNNDAQYLRPQSLKGIIACVDKVIAEEGNILGVGSKFSFSGTINMNPEGNNFYIDTKACNPYCQFYHNETIKKLDQSALMNLKAFDDTRLLEPQLMEHQYIDVPASMSIKELNHILFPTTDKQAHHSHLFRFGTKSLINMGGGDVQTFAGAFSTGTHGSGGAASSLHDMVRSMLIVGTKKDATGKLVAQAYRIEPSNGITDPLKHGDPSIELIQDDDTFYAAIVSMGSFGVIHSVIIETMPMVELHEEVIYMKGGWHKESENFAERYKEASKDGYHYVMVNPYKIKNEVVNSCAIKSVVGLNDQNRQLRRHKVDKRRPLKKILSSLAKNTMISKSLRDGDKPKAKSIETALKLLRDHDNEYETDFSQKAKGDGYIDYSYKVWNTGSGDLKFVGMGLEFAFKVEDVPEVVNKLLDKINNETGSFLNAPMSLRFCHPSKALLSPTYELDADGNPVDLWCYIEVLKIKDITSQDIDKELRIINSLQSFMFDLGGRPHWGLNFDLDNNHLSFNKLQELYPHFDKWINTYNKFNAPITVNGNQYRVFSNRLAPIFEA